MFWIIFGLLTLLAFLCAVLPLFTVRENSVETPPDIEVYKAQLREVEASIASGLLKGEAAKSAKIEMQRRLLKAAGRSEKSHRGQSQISASKSLLLYLVGMNILFMSVGIYFYLSFGAPEMPDFPLSIKTEKFAQNKQVIKIQSDIAKIKIKLAEKPDETIGWFALAHLEGRLGNRQKSAVAYEKTIALEPDNYNYHVLYAQSMISLSKGRVPPAAVLVLKRAALMKEASYGADYYLALYDFQQGDVSEAYKSWKLLEGKTKASDSWAPQLAEQIMKAEAALGLNKSPSKMAIAPHISKEQRAAVIAMATKDQQELIRSMVERLAGKMQENPTLAGWKRLGGAYVVLKEKRKAIEAFTNALALSKGAQRKEIEKKLEKLTIRN
jgi:cytochrome c-type biogenesis protein CcmH